MNSPHEFDKIKAEPITKPIKNIKKTNVKKQKLNRKINTNT